MGQVLLAAIMRWLEYNTPTIKCIFVLLHNVALLHIQLQVDYYQYTIIIANSMNVVDEARVDCILAQANINAPDSSHELLVAVGTSTIYTVYTKGMVPGEGSNR